MTSESQKQLVSFRAPDTGRLISWAEFGSPTGKPIIYLHGTPSSRLECQEFHEQLCETGIRLIAPDRPGFGRSEPDIRRTIGSYANDIKALAKHVELNEYVVMGGSGGGPYALACANHIRPEDGLRAVGVAAGIAPWECTLKDVSWGCKLSLYLAKWAPGLLKWLSSYSVPLPKSPPAGPLEEIVADTDLIAQTEKKMKEVVKQLKPRDREVMDKPEILKFFSISLVESFIQGYSGFAYEMDLFVKPWGFELEEIAFASERGRPLVLWYGTADENTPIHMGRWIAERVPGARYYEEEGETHLTLGLKFVDYCKQLLELGQQRS